MLRKAVNSFFCILLLGLVSNASALETQFDDNFDSYADDAGMKARWNGSWSDASISYSLDTGGNSSSGANSMWVKLKVDSGTVATNPNSSDPTGDVWGIVWQEIGGGDRGNMARATDIKVWVKPETFTTGLGDPFFRVSMKESSTIGGDKFISPRYYLKDLNAAGEVMTIPIDSLVSYSGADAYINLSNEKTFYIWMGYSGTVADSVADSAVVWVDDVEMVVGETSDLVDDFELYGSDAHIQGYFPWTGAVVGGTPVVSLDATGGSDGDKAMQVDFSFSTGDVDPWAYAGGSVVINARNWSDYKGISLWVKGSTTGDTSQYIEIAIHEGDSTGDWGDKLHSDGVSLDDLNPAGEYVYLYFDNFVDYSGFGGTKDNGVLDLDYIGSIFVFGKYSGTATQNSSATVLIDDISVFKIDLPLTHLDDNFESYANNNAMLAKWGAGPYWGANINGVDEWEPDEMTVTRSLSLDEGSGESRAIQIDVTVDAGVAPRTTLGGNVPWEPLIHTMTGFYVSGGNRMDLTEYGGIRFWVKPGPMTGDGEVVVRLTIEESSSIGGERWISPKVYTDNLDPAGEYVAFGFGEFTEYVKGTGQDMERTSLNMLWLWLTYETQVMEANTATVWFDDIEVIQFAPPLTHLNDNFDQYADSTALAAKWGAGPYTWSGGAMAIDLDATGGFEGSPAMEIDFSYAAGSDGPGGVIGFYTSGDDRTDLTDYAGIGMWIQAVATSDDVPFFTLRLVESSTIGEEKWRSHRVVLDRLDPAGQYVYFDFAEFVEYNTGSGEAMDRTSIKFNYLGLDYNGVSANGGSATILVDNIEVLEDPPIPPDRVHLDDHFERYVNGDALAAKWSDGPYPWGGGTMAIDLAMADGSEGSQGMEIDFSYPAASDGPGAVIGFYTPLDKRTDLTDYAGIGLWIKADTTSGDVPFFSLRLLESSTIGGEKWRSPSVILNDLDPAGEYVYLDFDDFVEYQTGSGEAMDRTSIKVNFLGLDYEGVAANGGSAVIVVDDITVIEFPLPVTHLDDNFEDYADNSAMLAKWGAGPYWGANINGVDEWEPDEMTVTRSLSLDEGSRESRAIQIDVTVDAGVAPRTTLGGNVPWEPLIHTMTGFYVSGGKRMDLTDYGGIRFWVKPGPMTGDGEVVVRLTIEESSSIGGERWISPKVYTDNLDPAGEYVEFGFGEFTEYIKGTDQDMERTSLNMLWLWLTYEAQVMEANTATVWFDDIEVLEFEPPVTHFDDNFESYAANNAMVAKWKDTFWGANINGVDEWEPDEMTVTPSLSIDEGYRGSNAIQIDVTVDSGVAPRTTINGNLPWEPLIHTMNGFYVGSANMMDLTNYDSLSFWIKAGPMTGDGEVVFRLAIEEKSTGGNDRWWTPKVYVDNLDPAGEYVKFGLDEFTEYFRGSGQEMEKDRLNRMFLWVNYETQLMEYNTVTVWVDEIKVHKEEVASIAPQISAIPEKFALYQNYPNPFNPVTTIRYDLPSASDVKLVIYDILGREVIRLVNKRMESGYHTIRWNGRDKFGTTVASGVYIYMLNTDNFVKTKKLVLLK